MRGTLARMPRGLRLAMGLATAIILGFFGMVFLDSGNNDTLAYVLFGFGGFRLLLWFRELGRVLLGGRGSSPRRR